MGVQGTADDKDELKDLQAFVEHYAAQAPTAPAEGQHDRAISPALQFPNWPFPTPKPAPPFQPANYAFSVDSITIRNTRSRHQDTVLGTMNLAVGSGAAQSAKCSLGDLNNGTFPAQLSIPTIHIADPNVGVAFNYVFVNSGHASEADFDKTVVGAGEKLAAAGAVAATTALAGTAIGATIGTTALPIIGTILGAIAGWLMGQIGGILFANCDGPVAAEQPAFKGQDLWTLTHGFSGTGTVYTHTTTSPGLDSPTGCGSNSVYDVTWSIHRS